MSKAASFGMLSAPLDAEEEAESTDEEAEEEEGDAMADAAVAALISGIGKKDHAAVKRALSDFIVANGMETDPLLPMLVLRSDMAVKVRTLTGFESDGFVTSSELNAYLDDSFAELYEHLVETRGAEYSAKTATFTGDGVNSVYGISPTLMMLLSVDRVRGTSFEKVLKFQQEQRDMVMSLTGDGQYYYRLRGKQPIYLAQNTPVQIQVFPIPAANIVFQYEYVETLAKTTPAGAAPGDVAYDGVNGFELFAVYDVCAKLLEKQQEDSTNWKGRREEQRARILRLAPKRDVGAPEYQADVRRDDDGSTGTLHYPRWTFTQ